LKSQEENYRELSRIAYSATISPRGSYAQALRTRGSQFARASGAGLEGDSFLGTNDINSKLQAIKGPSEHPYLMREG
jgi:hypothetical protein